MVKHRFLLALALGGVLGGCSGAAMQPAVPSLQNGITPSGHNSSSVTVLPPMLRAALSASASWPQSYYGPGHTGYNPKETTLSSGNVSGLTLLGGPSTGCAPEAVVLYQGTLFTRHSGCGSIAGTLAAFDASTFAQKWSVTVGNWMGGDVESIAVGDGRVITGCVLSHSVGLCGYSPVSGKLLWSYNPCPASCGDDGFVQSGFSYANGVVYAVFTGGNNGSINGVYAVNAKTGTAIWSNVTGRGDNSIQSGSVAVGSYIYYACGKFQHGLGLCALNAADGSFAWTSYPNIGFGSAALAYSNGSVYVNSGCSEGCTPQVAAFSGTSGSLLWANATYGGSGNAWQSPAVAKGVAYFSVYPGSGPSLIALSGATGKLRWSVSETDQSAPSVANGVVYTVTTLDPNHFQTVAHGASDGKALWSAAANRLGNVPPPVIANGTLYSPDSGPTCGVCAYGLASQSRSRGVHVR